MGAAGRREYVSGNIFVREMRFDRAGDQVRGHAHNFDHTTYCVRGALRIETLDLAFEPVAERVIRAVDGENWMLIPKQDRHRITALEDNTVGHCIYAHRDAQGEVVQEYEGIIEGTM